MKRIYFLFALVVLATSSFAQRMVNLQCLPEQLGTSKTNRHTIANGEKILYDGDGNSEYWFVWNAKNLGPDSLIPGDSVKFMTGYGGIISFIFDTGEFLKKDSILSIVPVNSTGQEIAIPLAPNSGITVSSTVTGINWCDSVWAAKGPGNSTITDLPVSNNEDCHTVDITFWLTGINNVTYQADGFILFPNPAEGNLNVKFDFGNGAKDVSVALMDVVGKVVYQQTLGNVAGVQTHSINVSALPAGMYVAELNYNGQKIVSKVSIR